MCIICELLFLLLLIIFLTDILFIIFFNKTWIKVNHISNITKTKII